MGKILKAADPLMGQSDPYRPGPLCGSREGRVSAIAEKACLGRKPGSVL